MGQISWSRQLALAVALFVLGSFAFWLEYKQKPAKEAQEEQAKKIFALKDTPVEDIKLETQGRSFELSCLDMGSKLCKSGDNSKWELKKPSKLKADDTNANNLLSSLNGLTSSDTIDLKDETAERRQALLKEYGLDPASRSSDAVKVVSAKSLKDETTLYVGSAHPLGNGNFALVAHNGQPDETKVYLIPPYFASNFDHDLTYWRDKKILTVASHEVASFALESKRAGRIEGTKKDGSWTIRSHGEEFAGDIENIDSMLTGAQFLTAKGFVSDNKNDAKARAALKGTQLILSLTLQKEKGAQDKNDKEAPAPQNLKLFGKAETASHKPGIKEITYSRIYAVVSNLDPLFEVETSAKDRLDKSLKDLRLAKLITSMERFTARRLDFSGKAIGSIHITLVTKDGAKWTDENTKEEVSSEKVQSTLEKLSGNRIKDFVDLAKNSTVASGQKDGLELMIGDEKNSSKRHYIFWKSGSQLYARDLMSKRNEAFVVDNAVSDGLPWSPGFYKKTK